MNLIRSKLTILLVLISFIGYSQLEDNFSDGDLNLNPTWNGDVSDFIVNDNFLLQLDAEGAGESFLYNSYDATDSIEWNFYFRMDFNPSGGNNLKIYLALDNTDLAIANGYFLEIGEDGSDDALSFSRLVNGTASQLASATMGAVAVDPAEGRVRVKKSASGDWTVSVDYDGGIILSEELSFNEDFIPLSGSQFFGFYCTYTSTRSDKFFFDDIDVRTPEQDLSPPTLVEVNLISSDSLTLTYNELLNTSNSSLFNNIEVNNGIGNPTSININDLSPNILEITLGQELTSGTLYTVCSMDIQDLAGNPSEVECEEIFRVVSPEIGDLFINEILFNPPTGGADFIEIINTSDKFLSLDGLTIANTQNSQSDPIEEGLVMLPGEIIAFTKDPEFIIEQYEPLEPAQIIEQELPAFNADEGNAMLLFSTSGDEITLDSFDYSEDLHFVLLDDEKGVSLEKLDPTAETNGPDSWYSASTIVNFATPGYENSNFQNLPSSSEELVSIPNKVFSPNGDGNGDLLAIQFNLPNPGYVSNIKIYTDRGFLVKNVSNNMLLGTQSTVYWDGITDERILGDIGIYVLLIELFDDQGNKSVVKKTCVLADFID